MRDGDLRSYYANPESYSRDASSNHSAPIIMRIGRGAAFLLRRATPTRSRLLLGSGGRRERILPPQIIHPIISGLGAASDEDLADGELAVAVGVEAVELGLSCHIRKVEWVAILGRWSALP